jgi:biopolymer transport protein ExbD
VKIETRLRIIQGKYFSVPLIDVVFLLLIFFVLSSSFVQVSAININLPSVQGQQTSAEKLVVTIDKKNKCYFNDQVMNPKTLKEQLAKISTKYQIKSIIVRADKDAPHGVVAKVLALANSLNLNVYFAVAEVPGTQPIPIETD